MTDFVTILTHGRRLKAAVKDLTVTQLEEVSKKSDTIIANRREEEKERRAQHAEKIRKIEELKQAMAAAGIDISDLASDGVTATSPAKRKRAPKPPKYAIIDGNGERITWTGQGRMPNALKKATENGDNLAKYLIK